MKKKMRRLLGVVILMGLMTVGFAGCKKSECDMCGEEKRCKTYDNALLGEMDICDECKDDMQSWFN